MQIRILEALFNAHSLIKKKKLKETFHHSKNLNGFKDLY